MSSGGNRLTDLLSLQTNAAYVLFYHRQDKIRKPTLPAPNLGPAPPSNDRAGACKDDCDGTDADLSGASEVSMEMS